jgi:hypothetical protein
LGTFWLKIEKFWPFEEISIFSNDGHFGYRTALTDRILKGDHPRTFQQSFVEIGSLVTEEKIFFEISSPCFLFLAWPPSWLEFGITGHNFGRGSYKDHSKNVVAINPVVSEKIFI